MFVAKSLISAGIDGLSCNESSNLTGITKLLSGELPISLFGFLFLPAGQMFEFLLLKYEFIVRVVVRSAKRKFSHVHRAIFSVYTCAAERKKLYFSSFCMHHLHLRKLIQCRVPCVYSLCLVLDEYSDSHYLEA